VIRCDEAGDEELSDDPRIVSLFSALAGAEDLSAQELTSRIESTLADLPVASFVDEAHREEIARRLHLRVSMRKLAKSELTPALCAAGMTLSDAITVALHIGGEHLYILRLSKGHEITPEVSEFAKALRDLIAARERLGPMAEVAVRKLIKAADPSSPTLDATMASVRTLSQTLNANVTMPGRGRKPLEMLRTAINASARAWRVGAGKWPEATVIEDSGPTAPLFHFYARHAGVPVSKDIFQAGLKDAKREYERLKSVK
jgi:hypothetical protein